MNKVKVIWYNWVEYLRQPCNIWSRCMWYYAPINRMNIWKKSEFFSRKYFKEWKVSPRNFDMIQANNDFIAKYS